jgi:gliding motility-associated-like protein
MVKKLRLFLVVFFLLPLCRTLAQGSDFQCTPTDLGLLPFASPCTSAGGFTTGTVVTQNGTTLGATNDSLSGSITSCYAGPPLHDVWYSFTASETHVQISIQGIGASPLNNSYVAIYEVLTNECVGLIPRQCSMGSGPGIHTMEFGPLTFGVKYYLQVASGTPPGGDGNFSMSINSKAICSDCSKNSILNAYPLPVKAAYPPDTTVGFCYSVIGYNELYGNRLHGVVPVLGNGWDATSLTVYSAADSADFLGQWKWFNNLNLGAGGIVSGFFYDVGGDNDPRNNLGDNGNMTTIWTFCFSVKTQSASACAAGQKDLSIRFENYGDGESGSLVTTYDCSGDQDYVFDAHMDCCPKPLGVVPFAAGCNSTPDGSIIAYAGFSIFGFEYNLYNSDGVLVASYTSPPASTSPHTFGGLLEGNYYLYTNENTAGACLTAVNTLVPGPVDFDIQQVAFGCAAGTATCSNTAAVIVNSGSVASITWSNGDTGFLADSLCPGWTYVTVVDTGVVACSIVDSIYIINLPAASPYFDYSSFNYCTADSLVTVTDFPAASGGTFAIMTQPAGMSASDINPTTGAVDISGATFAGYVIVRYTSPPPCNAVFSDTMYIDVSPPRPLASAFPNQDLCVGGIVNPYTNPTIHDIVWYSDTALTTVVTTQAPSTTYDYFGGLAQTTGGTYPFFLIAVNTSNGCKSTPLPVTVTVYPTPPVDAGSSVTICPGYGVNLNSTGASSYLWSPSGMLNDPAIPAPVATPSSTTLFTVVGTDATSGCTASDTVTVFVSENGNCDVVTYNGFTPNGDGHNDYWHIDGVSVDPKNDVKVFNRWGDKIWETTGYNNTTNRWEGKTSKGKDAPAGTYYFILNYKGSPHTGYVELTR